MEEKEVKNASDVDLLRKNIEKEIGEIEKTLAGVGRVNPNNPEDWEPTPNDLNVSGADMNESADVMEEYEERYAVEVELENRLNNIKTALKKMDEGKFGLCEVCNGQIEADRLAANPSSATCKKHLND
ncbi:MAG: hypothetical protein COZ49_03815 [Candidatus Yonathbacteria bacterium CG_4_10_14_3_um_filter_47_65]|nr:MAG: hypothetical protein COX54_02455 [Candidatus Yonathbacteria bacterium CG23_combo_of_CG06-09_8_20_14_all_46_18]PIQ32910.1 MAG: hypothetical protein COW61_00725 [Candidatus Yonathbacteria bacterium CG17_big_fil_post_rev_8_21_14_2_50_46_19]PIX56117.1 MAG: hypothetical protein COZ49_03815 [Candidatus Yonathbacteria bacterium CG_4_10_14_3_um_filter_47_65]PJC19805.1 MAG: hypothetical protein CO061_04285 [Candidatus Yonathbacteria bacterium CG_4_9_14_0_2_um_filter_47_74]